MHDSQGRSGLPNGMIQKPGSAGSSMRIGKAIGGSPVKMEELFRAPPSCNTWVY